MTKMLLNISDLARYLEVSRPTAYVVVSKPDFPRAIMVGDRRMWNLEQVDSWRLSQAVPAG